MRNEAPSSRLGNVSWGAVATGTVLLRYVLALTLNALMNRDDLTEVQVPGTLL
jgi:hypothetical protein